MRSKYINFTSGRKYLTENGFSDVNFPHDVEILAIRRFFAYFGNFSLRMRSFDYITAAGLKSNFIFEFIEPVAL